MPTYDLTSSKTGRTYQVDFASDPTPEDVDYAINFFDAEDAAAPTEQPGFGTQLYESFAGGGGLALGGGRTSLGVLTGDVPGMAAGLSQMQQAQARLSASQTPEDVAFMEDIQKQAEELKQAEGFFPTLREAADLPLAALRRPGAALRTAVQSLPNIAITTPVTIAGGLAGAALGAPGSPVGSIVGAVATGGAANAAIEVGYALNDLLAERTNGASATMTEEQIAAFLEANPDIVDEAQRIGLTRGATIGAVEALGLKGAGRLTAAPARAAEQAARTALAREGVDLASTAAVREAMATPALREAAETAAKAATDQFNLTGRAIGAAGIEMGAAAGGELAAQAAAGQEIDYGEAFLETLGEGLAAPATVLAARQVDMPRGSVLRLPEQQAVEATAAVMGDEFPSVEELTAVAGPEAADEVAAAVADAAVVTEPEVAEAVVPEVQVEPEAVVPEVQPTLETPTTPESLPAVEAQAEAVGQQPAIQTPDETEIPEASGLPAVQEQPVVEAPAVEAEDGTALGSGQGEEEQVTSIPVQTATAAAPAQPISPLGEVPTESLPADTQPTSGDVGTVDALRAVATNTATPEQLDTLTQQGLARVVQGQPVITESGLAMLPSEERPRLTESERVAEIQQQTQDEPTQRLAPGGLRGAPSSPAEEATGEPDVQLRREFDLGLRAFLSNGVLTQEQADRIGFSLDRGRIAIPWPNTRGVGGAKPATETTAGVQGFSQVTFEDLRGLASALGASIEVGQTEGSPLFVRNEPDGRVRVLVDPSAAADFFSRGTEGNPRLAMEFFSTALYEELTRLAETRQSVNTPSSEIQPSLRPLTGDAQRNETLARRRRGKPTVPTGLRTIDGAPLAGITPTLSQATQARTLEAAQTPGAQDTWIGTAEEYLAENPDASFVADNPTLEAFYDPAVDRAVILTDRVQVREGDAVRAARNGTSAGLEAVRRLIRHESFVHRGWRALPQNLKNEFLSISENVVPADDLDQLAKVYKRFASWRSDPAIRALAVEEWLAQRLERIEKLPAGSDSVLNQLVDWAKRVWQWLAGDDSVEPTRAELVELMRQMVRALETGEKEGVMAGIRASLADTDAEYMRAVEANDLETAQRLVDQAARAAGYDVGPWYHGTRDKNFTVFDPAKAGANMPDNRYGPKGFWFARNPSTSDRFARGGRVLKVALKLNKRLEGFQLLSRGGEEFKNSDADYIQTPGVAVVKNPNQIKSADPITYDDQGNVIPLSQRFQPESPDIRFSLTGNEAEGYESGHFIGGAVPSNPRLPIFTTTDREGAEWYAENRGDGGQVYPIAISAKNSLPLNSEADIINLLPILDAAGVEYKFSPSSASQDWWTLNVPEVQNYSGYDGSNPLDVAYIPSVRAELVRRGHDSLSAMDQLENTEIPAVVLVRSPSQLRFSGPTPTDIRFSLTGNEAEIERIIREDRDDAESGVVPTRARPLAPGASPTSATETINGEEIIERNQLQKTSLQKTRARAVEIVDALGPMDTWLSNLLNPAWQEQREFNIRSPLGQYVIAEALNRVSSVSGKSRLRYSTLNDLLARQWQTGATESATVLAARSGVTSDPRYAALFTVQAMIEQQRKNQAGIIDPQLGSTEGTVAATLNADTEAQQQATEDVDSELRLKDALYELGLAGQNPDTQQRIRRVNDNVFRLGVLARLREQMRARAEQASFVSLSASAVEAEYAAMSVEQLDAEVARLEKEVQDDLAALETERKKVRRTKPKGTVKTVVEQAQDLIAKLEAAPGVKKTPKPNPVRDLYKAHLKQPMAEGDFVRAMVGAGVPEADAAKLYELAAVKIAAAEATKVAGRTARLMDREASSLENLINKLRPKITGGLNWREVFDRPLTDQREWRQQLFDTLRADPALANLSPAEVRDLAAELDRVWNDKRLATFKALAKRMNLPGAKEGVKEKIAESAPALIRYINSGAFNNENFRNAIADKFGVPPLDEARVDEVIALVQKAQAEGITQVERNKLMVEAIRLMQRELKVETGEMISNYWVTSVLSGFATLVDMALAVLNGARVMTQFSADAIIRQRDFKLAGRAAKRYFQSLGNAILESSYYFVSGDPSMLDNYQFTLNTYMREGSAAANPFDYFERLIRDPNRSSWAKVVPYYFAGLQRVMTAFDHINATSTAQGTLEHALAYNRKLFGDARMPSEQDVAAARAKAVELAGGDRTYAQKRKVTAYTRQILNEEYNKNFPGLLDEAKDIGRIVAYQNDPTGIGGMIYHTLLGLTNKWVSEAGNFRDAGRAQGEAQSLTSKFMREFMYILAVNARNISGTRFVRFVGNRVNELISFTPGAGFLRLYEKDTSPTRRAMLLQNQAVGIMVGAWVAMTVLRMMNDEDDDEKRGFRVSGSWQGLTPDRKNQLRANNQVPNSIQVWDGEKWVSFNYVAWPVASLLATVGNLNDMKKYHPEKWDPKSQLDRFLAAAWAGAFSFKDLSAISGFMELLGTSAYSSDPVDSAIKWLGKFSSNYIGGVVPRMLKDIDMIMDPKARKPTDVSEHFAKEVPFYRRTEAGGEKMFNIFGEQVELNRLPWRRVVTASRPEKEYQILAELNNRGLFLGVANADNRTVGMGASRRKLTDEEAERYAVETGKRYRQFVLDQGERLLEMPEEQAKLFLSRRTEALRNAALRDAIRTPP